jgi:hypothetical protein
MKLSLVSTLAAFLLIGCGGSSESIIKKVNLNGVAVDDLIVNGIVKAYPANNPNRVLATGKTNNKGAYTLDVAYDGVVRVEVECKKDTSWMINPVNPTVKIDCVDGLKLNSAALVSPDQGAVEVNISPLTELVVKQMQEKNRVTEQDLTVARNNIQQMFLVDPLEADPTEGDYAKIIGAIHKVADQDDSKNIMQVIDEIAEDYKDGEAGDDNQEISEKLASAMEEAGVANPLTYKKGVFTPVEVDPNIDGIQASKDFFKELRTQAMSIVDYQESGTDGFLDTEAKSLGNTVEDISINISTASEVAVNHVTKILDLINKNQTSLLFENEDLKKTISYKKESSLVWNYEINVSGQTTASGTITLPSENPDDISLKTYTGTLTAKFDGTVPLEFENYVAIGHQQLKADISMTKKDYGSDVTLTDATLTSGTTSISMKDLKAKAYYSFDTNDEVIMDHVIFDTVTLEASVTPYKFSGTLSAPEYVQNGTIKGNGFMVEETEDTMPSATSGGSPSKLISSRVNEADKEEGFYNSGYLPKKVVYEGIIAKDNSDSYISGKIVADWLNAEKMSLVKNSNEEPVVDVSVTGKIKAVDRQEMMISLGYTNLNNISKFRFVYAYDSTIINGTGTFDKEVDNGTIVLTTLNGLKSTIKVTNGDVVYGPQSSVTKNSTIIGELQERNGVPVIKYTDGTFESLP